MRTPYIINRNKAQCDICGRTRLDTDLRLQWDGFMACRDRCWSPKHPNEYPRQVPNDGLPVPNARPRVEINNMPSVVLGGYTNWTNSELRWEDATWTWEDNISSVTLAQILAGGNI